MAETTHTLQPGTVLQDRYRIEEVVGRGGMGAVYRATDTRIEATVAVKEMLEQPGTPDQREQAVLQFKREARFLGQLSHPNIPKVTDYFVENGRWYLVMEFIYGQTLEAILQQNGGNPLPLRRVLAWSLQLADVLQYLHSQDPPIVFRDLKPANIMLTDSGTIKLIDFGIARRFDVKASKDTLLYGSPGYSPPEQYGRSQTDPRADLYAFGATLHHLLTGRDPSRTPFKFPSVRSLNPYVPPALDEFVLRCVRMDPEERISSAADARQILQEISIQAAEPQPARTPKHNALRPGWVAYAVIVAALLAGGLGVVAMLQSRRMHPPRVPAQATPIVPGTVPGASSGSIQVTSTPPGAQIYVDDRLMGTTPALIPQIPAGRHTLHLIPATGSGLADWFASVDVQPGENTPIDAKFTTEASSAAGAPVVQAHAIASLTAGPPGNPQDAVPGIQMDATFQIAGAAGKTGRVALCLFGADGSTPIRPADPQSRFQNARGQLSVAQSFQATSDPYEETGIHLFIPLTEVPIPPEQVTWQMVVFLGDQPVYVSPVQPLRL